MRPRPAPCFSGRGPEEERLRRRAAELGVESRVRFLAAVDDETLLGLYAEARIVAVTASGEDLGYVPLEAYLSGKPVLTTEDAGGPLEFVRDGETGLVVAPRPEALGVALRLAWSRLGRPGGDGGGREAPGGPPDLGRARGEAPRRGGARVSGGPDPLRRLAQERGRILGELGVRPDDARWARVGGRRAREPADAVAAACAFRAPLGRLVRRLARFLR